MWGKKIDKKLEATIFANGCGNILTSSVLTSCLQVEVPCTPNMLALMRMDSANVLHVAGKGKDSNALAC